MAGSSYMNPTRPARTESSRERERERERGREKEREQLGIEAQNLRGAVEARHNSPSRQVAIDTRHNSGSRLVTTPRGDLPRHHHCGLRDRVYSSHTSFTRKNLRDAEVLAVFSIHCNCLRRLVNLVIYDSR